MLKVQVPHCIGVPSISLEASNVDAAALQLVFKAARVRGAVQPRDHGAALQAGRQVCNQACNQCARESSRHETSLGVSSHGHRAACAWRREQH
jgi:hypothetical protein